MNMNSTLGKVGEGVTFWNKWNFFSIIVMTVLLEMEPIVVICA